MEQPIDSFRSSTWGWLRGTLAGWGTIALVPVGILLTAVAPPEIGRWPMVLTAVALLIVLWKWFENMAARYDVCPDRLIVREGIFIKSLDEVELYRVKDVRLDFSLINQMAGIGTITVTSSDQTTRDAPLILRHVERAAHRREELRRLVEAARQKRRVREIDMMHEDF
ncbi:MAG TPA: PH domain-containing protein [Allosphingosinicella sp.]|nr:PH domain-containing protein [Allosphingosinicella sp.]